MCQGVRGKRSFGNEELIVRRVMLETLFYYKNLINWGGNIPC